MNLATVAVKNIARNWIRTSLTVVGVAVAILGFVLLRTLIWSSMAHVEHSQTDRIGIRNKVAMVMPLPKTYVDDVRKIPGLKATLFGNWFGAKYPKRESEFFQSVAVDPEDLLRVYDEFEVTPSDAESWKQNRRGAMVGDQLAKKFGWKRGDLITLRGTIYPGDWQFEIVAIYSASRPSLDRSSLFFHWNYLNDALPAERQNQIGWIAGRIDGAARSADVCRAIDATFAERDVQTLCMSERGMQTALLGMFSAVLKAVDLVSVFILVIMTLIVGNTIAMGVRERTAEYGTLRAIGFVPRHVALVVLGESLATGLLGGAVGLLLAYPIVDRAVGRFVEENLGAFFPFFRIQPSIALLALGAAVALSATAALFPAYGIARLKVVDALRRVG